MDKSEALKWCVENVKAWPEGAIYISDDACEPGFYFRDPGVKPDGWRQSGCFVFWSANGEDGLPSAPDVVITKSEYQAARDELAGRSRHLSRDEIIEHLKGSIRLWPNKGDRLPELPNGCGWKWDSPRCEGAPHALWPTDLSVSTFGISALQFMYHEELMPLQFGGIDISSIERGEKTWIGEGLPPVGVECEVSNCGSEWQRIKVLYMGSGICVVQQPYGEQHYHLNSVKFRPIHTERDKAEEAVRNAIFSCPAGGCDGGAALVIDALDAGKIPGYGKIEE